MECHHSCSSCSCLLFEANRFKPNLCTGCGHDAFDHEGLSDELQAAAVLAKDDKVPCKITEGLFMGGMKGAMNDSALGKVGITHVINCARDISRVWPGFKPTYAADYLKLDLQDTHDQDILEAVDKGVQFIKDAIDQGGIVYCHCAQGVSRSGAICVAFIMDTQSMGYDEALQLVRKGRICAKPNSHFEKQLRSRSPI